MTEQKKDYARELRNILEALAESAATASDEDILSEATEEGLDPQVEANRLRMVLHNSLLSIQKERLRTARQQYEKHLKSMTESQYPLPDTPNGRRQLLQSLLLKIPDLQRGLVTAQGRELSDLSDSDIESCLRQLCDLGAIKELDEKTMPEE